MVLCFACIVGALESLRNNGYLGSLLWNSDLIGLEITLSIRACIAPSGDFSAVQASWEAGAGEEMTEGWACEGQKTKERKERGSCLEAGDYADRRLGRGF